jgi:hypothetical protein
LAERTRSDRAAPRDVLDDFRVQTDGEAVVLHLAILVASQGRAPTLDLATVAMTPREARDLAADLGRVADWADRPADG